MPNEDDILKNLGDLFGGKKESGDEKPSNENLQNPNENSDPSNETTSQPNEEAGETIGQNQQKESESTPSSNQEQSSQETSENEQNTVKQNQDETTEATSEESQEKSEEASSEESEEDSEAPDLAIFGAKTPAKGDEGTTTEGAATPADNSVADESESESTEAQGISSSSQKENETESAESTDENKGQKVDQEGQAQSSTESEDEKSEEEKEEEKSEEEKSEKEKKEEEKSEEEKSEEEKSKEETKEESKEESTEESKEETKSEEKTEAEKRVEEKKEEEKKQAEERQAALEKRTEERKQQFDLAKTLEEKATVALSQIANMESALVAAKNMLPNTAKAMEDALLKSDLLNEASTILKEKSEFFKSAQLIAMDGLKAAKAIASAVPGMISLFQNVQKEVTVIINAVTTSMNLIDGITAKMTQIKTTLQATPLDKAKISSALGIVSGIQKDIDAITVQVSIASGAVTNLIGILNSVIDEIPKLESIVKDANSKLSEYTNGDIDFSKATDAASGVAGKVGGMGAIVSDIATKANKALADLNAIVAKVNSDAATVVEIVKKLLEAKNLPTPNATAVLAALSKLEGSLPAIIGQLSPIKTDFGGFISMISGMIKDLALSSSLGGIMNGVLGLFQIKDGGTTGALGAIGNLVSQLPFASNLLSEGTAILDGIGGKIDEIIGSIPGLADKIPSIQGLLKDPASALAGLEQLAALAGDAEALKGILSGALTSLPGLDTLKNSLGSFLNGSNSSASGALGFLNSATSAIGGALGDVENLSGLLSSAAGSFGAITGINIDTSLITNTLSKVSGLVDKASKAGEFLSGIQDGSISLQDALSQIGSLDPTLGSLVGQFESISSAITEGMAAVESISGQITEGLNAVAGIQDTLGKLASGEMSLTEAIGQIGEIANQIPIIGDLITQFNEQFPEISESVTAGLEKLQEFKDGFETAKAAFAQLQAGASLLCSEELTDIAEQLPIVNDLLAKAEEIAPGAVAKLRELDTSLPGLITEANTVAETFKGFLRTDQTMLDNISNAAQLASTLPALETLATNAIAQVETVKGVVAETMAVVEQGQEILEQANNTIAKVCEVLEAENPVAAAVEAAVAAVAASAITTTALAEAEPAEGPPNYLTISTPLGGEEVFVIEKLTGTDAVNTCFTYTVDMTATDSTLDFTAMVGQAATVKVDYLDTEDSRYINGIITKFALKAGENQEALHYVAELRPWFYLSGMTTNFKVFQNMTVDAIIEEVLADISATDYELKLNGTYAEREYTVQYRETAINFISRLMEDEGIFYYFKHEDGLHTMVITDDASNYEECPGISVAKMRSNAQDAAADNVIVELSSGLQVFINEYKTTDYSFEAPSTSLLVTTTGNDAGVQTTTSYYVYPSTYKETSPEETQGSLRLEAFEREAKTVIGKGYNRSFIAGFKFTLEEHDREDANQEYVLISTQISATQEKYNLEFTAVPATVNLRPDIKTEKPLIHGYEVGIVVGSDGEEIWTDEYGRVKVQFYWDQLGEKNENSSCWIRVAQMWAGKGYGTMFIPRMGMEVVVSFLCGDPDRPLVIGTVYNAEQTIPYAMPDNQTRSTIKTWSSKEGEYGNELRFEDKIDEEEILLLAQKDLQVHVKNDYMTVVKANRQTWVHKPDDTFEGEIEYKELNADAIDYLEVEGGDKYTLIKGDDSLETRENEGEYKHLVTKDFSLIVDGDTLLIEAANDLVIKGKKITIESTEEEIIITSAANLEVDVADDYTIAVGGDHTNEVDGDITLDAGGDFTATSGTAFTIEAGTDFEATAEMNVTLTASLEGKFDGGLNCEISGTQAKIEADAICTVKGSMVMIN